MATDDIDALRNQLHGVRAQVESLQQCTAPEPPPPLDSCAGFLSAIELPPLPRIADSQVDAEDLLGAELENAQRRCFSAVYVGRRDAFYALVRQRVEWQRKYTEGVDSAAAEVNRIDSVLDALPPLGKLSFPSGVTPDERFLFDTTHAAVGLNSWSADSGLTAPHPTEIEAMLLRRIQLRAASAPFATYLDGIAASHQTHTRSLLHEAAWSVPSLTAVPEDDLASVYSDAPLPLRIRGERNLGEAIRSATSSLRASVPIRPDVDDEGAGYEEEQAAVAAAAAVAATAAHPLSPREMADLYDQQSLAAAADPRGPTGAEVAAAAAAAGAMAAAEAAAAAQRALGVARARLHLAQRSVDDLEATSHRSARARAMSPSGRRVFARAHTRDTQHAGDSNIARTISCAAAPLQSEMMYTWR